jgi:hypothetical protein
MLTTRFVATARPGRYLDQKGLYLEVSPTGKKRWVLRHSRDKRVTEASLGSAEFISLAEAREKAFEFRKALATGIIPAKRVTFGVVARDVVINRRASFRDHSSSHHRWGIAQPLRDPPTRPRLRFYNG